MISDWLRKFYDVHSGSTLAYMSLPGVSMQQRASLFITSKPTESDVKQHKVARITQRNLIPFAVYLAVRHCITLTWENNKDEFCHPNTDWISDEEFKYNCLVFVLFDNVIKSADGVNHWIPFTEEEVNAKSCFKSHFMSDFINGKAVSPLPADAARPEAAPYQSDLFADARDARSYQASTLQDSKTPSSESNAPSRNPNPVNPVNPVKKENLTPAARAVLDAGRELWRYYHAQPNANPNASYYDIRLHFQGVKRTASGKEQMNATSSDATYNALLANLRAAHKNLAAQIAPKVYEYGFLKQ